MSASVESFLCPRLPPELHWSTTCPRDRIARSRQHLKKKEIESDFQKGCHPGRSILISGKPRRICSSFLFHLETSMPVVRVQLFSLIIRSSEVESTHLCGGEKSLALFIPHSISRGCFPGCLGPRESRLIHSSSVWAIKILPLGNSGFFCYGCCWRKGASTRTHPRRCQKNLKEKPSRNPGILLL